MPYALTEVDTAAECNLLFILLLVQVVLPSLTSVSILFPIAHHFGGTCRFALPFYTSGSFTIHPCASALLQSQLVRYFCVLKAINFMNVSLWKLGDYINVQGKLADMYTKMQASR